MNMYLVLDLNLATFQYIWIGCYHFCLTRFGLELMIFCWSSSQLSVLFWNCSLLYWQEFLKFVEIVYCVCFNVEPCLWQTKKVCSTDYHVIKLTELVGHSLIQSLFLTYNCYTLRIHLAQFIIFYMFSPVLTSHLCCILLVFWFDILHAIAELNRTSHCIATNIEYFEVSTVSIVMILWANSRT